MNDLSTLDAFLIDVAPIATYDREAQQKLSMKNAPEFRALSFFHSGEVVETEILAYFLNPSEAHGQYDVLLKAFLNALHIDLGNHALDSVTVETNAPCYKLKPRHINSPMGLELNESNIKVSIGDYGYRMMDILIQLRTGGEEHVLVIESKSRGAGDQDKQINDYLQHICEAYPARRKYLVYMKDESPPNKKSIEPAKWDLTVNGHRICYPVDFAGVMKTWIKNCLDKCTAPKIRFFLQDFAAFLNLEIDKMVPADTKMSQRVVEIIDAAAAKSNTEDSKFTSIMAIYEMHEEIWKRVVTHCMNRTGDFLAIELPDWVVSPVKGYFDEGKFYIELKIHRPAWGRDEPDLCICLASGDWVNDQESEKSKPTYFDLFIIKKKQFSPIIPQDFDDEKGFLRIGPRKNDRTRKITLAGIRDLKSSEGLRSLLTEQAAKHIATEIVRLAGEYQSAMDACFPIG